MTAFSTLRKLMLPALFVLGLAGCKEEYYPALQSQKDALVVQGLITNIKEPYKVKLTLATAYDSTVHNEGITGAAVSVVDDLGRIYTFHENHNLKEYFSDPSEFVAESGRSYSMHITMPDGETYESDAQKMFQSAGIDSMRGITINKEFWYENQLGKLVSKMVYGAETFMDISFASDSVYQFRLDNYVIKCYCYMELLTREMIAAGVKFPPPKDCPGAVCPYLIYNWKRFDLNTTTVLSEKTHNLVSRKILNNTACFFSFDSAAFPVTYVTDSCALDPMGVFRCAKIRRAAGPEGKALQTRLYSLNQEASNYYQQINKQLSAEGKLFDPIAVQIKGNIRCTSNPDKLALGFFEVSSCATKSYWMTFDYGAGKVFFQQIEDLTGLPDSGGSKIQPDFWLH